MSLKNEQWIRVVLFNLIKFVEESFNNATIVLGERGTRERGISITESQSFLAD